MCVIGDYETVDYPLPLEKQFFFLYASLYDLQSTCTTGLQQPRTSTVGVCPRFVYEISGVCPRLRGNTNAHVYTHARADTHTQSKFGFDL